MNIGYARVSTSDQNLDLQLDALRAVGCERIFDDVASGAKSERPGLRQALDYLRKGDTLVVWKLDRLGRSLPDLLATTNLLETQGKGFRSLQESLDTTSSAGRLIFHIFASLADFERNLIRERTNAGLAAARARGRHGGRPRSLNSRGVQMAKQLLKDPFAKFGEVAETLDVSRSTLYRALKAADESRIGTELRSAPEPVHSNYA